jgi:hypothetical protein
MKYSPKQVAGSHIIFRICCQMSMNHVNIVLRYWHKVESKLKKLLGDWRWSIVSVYVMHLARLKSSWNCFIVICSPEKELISAERIPKSFVECSQTSMHFFIVLIYCYCCCFVALAWYY